MNEKFRGDCNWSRNTGDTNHSQYTDPAWDIMSSPEITQQHLLHREHAGQNVKDAELEGEGVAEARYTIKAIIGEKKLELLNMIGWSELSSFVESSREITENEGKSGLLSSRENIEDLEQRMILLYCEDYNCKGMIGPEAEFEKMNPDVSVEPDFNTFLGLVRSEGMSAKENQAGGNFGIGKVRLWVHSGISTVFIYSRLSKPYRGHTRRLIGVNRLPAGPQEIIGNEIKNHSMYAYFGVKKESPGGQQYCSSLYDEDADEMAEKLGFTIRVEGEEGTSVLIIDYNPREDKKVEDVSLEWIRDDLVKASDWYCWPAIIRGELSLCARVEGEEWKYSNPQNRDELKPFIDLHDVLEGQKEPTEDMTLEKVSMKIPSHKDTPTSEPTEECQAEFQLAISVREKFEGEDIRSGKKIPRPFSIALIRGAGLVVCYDYLRNTNHDTKTYHAILLGGEAHTELGDTDCQSYQEKLLGYAEPATHDAWDPETSREKFRNWKGAKKALENAITNVRKIIRASFKTQSSPKEGDASPLFASMFQFGKQPGSTSNRVIEHSDWSYERVEEEGGVKYVITGEIGVPVSSEETRYEGTVYTSRWALEIGGYVVDVRGKPLREAGKLDCKLTHWREGNSEFKELEIFQYPDEPEEDSEDYAWCMEDDQKWAVGRFLEDEAMWYEFKGETEIITEPHLISARVNFTPEVSIRWDTVEEVEE